MNDEECYVVKLSVVLKENCDITRKDYSFARKYDKCLLEIGKFYFQNVSYDLKSNIQLLLLTSDN